jgi:hypothetical protein
MTHRFDGLTRMMGRRNLALQANSPKLLFGAGVVGMVGSTVLACRATLRLEEVLETAQNDLDMAKTVNAERPDQYSDRDRQKDVALIYTRSVISVGKLYGPSVLVGAASIACLTKSHNILSQRNLALTAAYAAVDEAFTAYRERVIEKYGEEQDQLFRYAHEEVEVLDERGKLHTEFRAAPDAAPSMYARYYDEYAREWSKEPEYNLVFLRNQQNYWNDVLKMRGHVFLNEVYDALGLDHTRAGSVVGWRMTQGEGDNYIDFGLYNRGDDQVRNFINGREGSILLDFNVDGVIFDKIKDPGERLKWQS